MKMKANDLTLYVIRVSTFAKVADVIDDVHLMHGSDASAARREALRLVRAKHGFGAGRALVATILTSVSPSEVVARRKTGAR